VPPESPPLAVTRRDGPGPRDYSTTVYLDAGPWDLIRALIRVPEDARLVRVVPREFAVILVFQVPPPPMTRAAPRINWTPIV